jgi:hypothetical protein
VGKVLERSTLLLLLLPAMVMNIEMTSGWETAAAAAAEMGRGEELGLGSYRHQRCQTMMYAAAAATAAAA